MFRQLSRSVFIVLFLSWLLSAGFPNVSATPYPSREEVLEEVYGPATAEPERLFLTKAEQSAAGEKAGEEVPSPLIARYLLKNGATLVGRAYVDTHVVRTKKQSILVCLSSEGTVLRIEVTAFQEPPEYLVPDIWYKQYEGRGLSEDLRLQRDIRSVAGATLTAMATGAAVRRVLAIDEVLRRKTTGGVQ